MRFYLGTHHSNWLGLTNVPLFISRRRLQDRRTFPRALGPWALDSGGFSELSMFGAWQVTPKQYAAQVLRFGEEIGQLAWAAPQDWMCEPSIIAKTGLSVAEHQARTTANYLELRGLNAPVVPVLQGWEYGDYLEHMEGYAKAGVCLTAEPLVGVGTICRRQNTLEAAAILTTIRALGVRIHGFGLKTDALKRIGLGIESADSMAWSSGARWRPALEGHTHKSCANCLEYALQWRGSTLAALPLPSSGGQGQEAQG